MVFEVIDVYSGQNLTAADVRQFRQMTRKHANGRSELMAADVHQESDALHQNNKNVEHCMAAVFDDCRHKRTSDKLNSQRAL